MTQRTATTILMLLLGCLIVTGFAQDQEFGTGSFAGYDVYIPAAGPSINLTDRVGWVRISAPASQKFDHWTNVDNAPQLRRDVTAGDWQLETSVDLIYATTPEYHAGLIVYFSRYDIFYWGYNSGYASLKLSRSGQGGLVNVAYGGGTTVKLRIRKAGTTYYFDYKGPSDVDWTQAGSQTTSTAPASVGVISKTWRLVDMIVDFDYLRLSGGQLSITTTALSPGQIGNSYSAHISALGGVLPLSWSVSGGSLPPGLSLNPTTGQITGTPTTEGTFDFTVQVTDNDAPPALASQPLSIVVSATPVIDPEFTSGSLSGYTVYTPAAGPTINATDRAGWLRMEITEGNSFDHWTTSDRAPQLRRALLASNWQVQTRLELTLASGAHFHTGLSVYFSRYDIFYWGFNGNTGTLKLSRSGQGGLINSTYNGGNVVDLRIRKEGTSYYFEHKMPADLQWTLDGVQVTSTSPVDIGTILKTWAGERTIADFDYLRLGDEEVVVATTQLPGGQIGALYSTNLTAQGGISPYSWSLTGGALPPGLVLNGAAGQVSGTPTQVGTFNFTVQVTDNSVPQKTATRALSIDVTDVPPLHILTTNLPDGAVGSPYLQTLAPDGGVPPYSWSLAGGALPGGVVLNSSTGTLSGTPTSEGTFDFTVRLNDSLTPLGLQASVTRDLTIVIAAEAVIDEEFITGSLNGYTTYIPSNGPVINAIDRQGWLRMQVFTGGSYDHWVGKDFAPQLRRPAPAGDWQVETRLELTQVTGIKFHTGLNVYFSRYDIFYWGYNGTNNTLKLSRTGRGGLVTATYNGGSAVDLRIRKVGTTYHFEYKNPASQQWTEAGTQTVSETPAELGTIIKTWESMEIIADFDYLRLLGNDLTITTSTMPGGNVGVTYSAPLAAQGGTSPYQWSLVGGALPGGVVLNGATGHLTGTPTQSGTFNFDVRVADNGVPQATDTKSLTIQIAAPPGLSITTANLPGGFVNDFYSQILQAQGGLLPYAWSLFDGALPGGLVLNGQTGLLSGTPTTVGTFNFTVKAVDSANPAAEATRALSIVIGSQPVIDEEFVTTNLNGYTIYIPAAGPTVNSSDRLGWLRMNLPQSGSFDHWYNTDRAPQLRRPVEPGDWEVETRVELTTVNGAKFHTGLLVYFSQYDMFYWGYNTNNSTLKLSRSGQGGLINVTYAGGNFVDLRIRKVGTTYNFEYKGVGETLWQLGGIQTTTTVPVEIGVIAKTWELANYIVDFDYLRLVGEELTIVTTALPAGQMASAYSAQLTGRGGAVPYTWSVTGGNLPQGLALNPATGQITGIPTQVETAVFTIQVVDSQNPAEVAAQEFSIQINPIPPLQFTTETLPGGFVGRPYSATVVAEGGVTPYTFSLSTGSLPSGLSLDTGSGGLSGLPTLEGTYNFTVRVQDVQNPAASTTRPLSIVVTLPPPFNEEFDTDDLSNYTVYIPKAGPIYDFTGRPGWLRVDMLVAGTYDHWMAQDEGGIIVWDDAPQLRRQLPETDQWEISTKLSIQHTSKDKYMAGLQLYFSRYDLFYFGFGNTTEKIVLSRSKKPSMAVATYNGGNEVELRIKRDSQYTRFEYRQPGTVQWTDILAHPYHAQLAYSHPLDNSSPSPLSIIDNRGGQFIPGEGWKSTTTTSQLFIKLPQNLPNEGSVVLDVSNFDPVAQNARNKQHIINIHSRTDATKDSWWAPATFIAIRTGTLMANPPFDGAGFAFWGVRSSVHEGTEYFALRGSPWDSTRTYEWRFTWDNDRVFLFIDDMFQGVIPFNDRSEAMRYLFLGTDNVYNAQPGPIYSNLRIYLPGGPAADNVAVLDSQTGEGDDPVAAQDPPSADVTRAWPHEFGLITKTFEFQSLVADYDYLRLVETVPSYNIAVSEILSEDRRPVEIVDVPEEYSLSQNYPNPFNPVTRVKLALPESQHTTAVIYNIQGQHVRTVLDQMLSTGSHEIAWDSRDDMGIPLNSGVYFMRVRSGDRLETRKLLLIR